jgi:hypothetical protein
VIEDLFCPYACRYLTHEKIVVSLENLYKAFLCGALPITAFWLILTQTTVCVCEAQGIEAEIPEAPQGLRNWSE